MWTISRTVSIGALAVLSVMDIHSRRIPVFVLIFGNLSMLGYQIFIGKGDIWLIAGGIGIGILFLLISRVTGEGIWYGDSWLILIMGIYLGVWKLLEALMSAFLFLGAAAAVCLALKKMSKKYKLPFIPFLTAGYLFNILVEGIG